MAQITRTWKIETCLSLYSTRRNTGELCDGSVGMATTLCSPGLPLLLVACLWCPKSDVDPEAALPGALAALNLREQDLSPRSSLPSGVLAIPTTSYKSVHVWRFSDGSAMVPMHQLVARPIPLDDVVLLGSPHFRTIAGEYQTTSTKHQNLSPCPKMDMIETVSVCCR
ncbi:hypothetical protein SODALDRAFT_333076 [Sodiomyces alkalinus F11]|uniref:Uncharacterized protein n=1 Tax=Sodiomyces alkalinus (strain CBS 110278 / VKM F-3762 / F11) TaxID=1314773 RepID=A0A3N2PVE1_SODAK|nr:hypothetical protein SODALDRAFT_333076 [Sodiomyces alkalinus F11]ROT38483.1 hypothetical protein SODALDRAFT_333076 [Sodiomyces alkalinus F11]